MGEIVHDRKNTQIKEVLHTDKNKGAIFVFLINFSNHDFD